MTADTETLDVPIPCERPVSSLNCFDCGQHPCEVEGDAHHADWMPAVWWVPTMKAGG